MAVVHLHASPVAEAGVACYSLRHRNIKCEIIPQKPANDGYLHRPDYWAGHCAVAADFPGKWRLCRCRSRDGAIGRDKTLQFLKDTIAIISQTRQANPILLPSDVCKSSSTTAAGWAGTDRTTRIVLYRMASLSE